MNGMMGLSGTIGSPWLKVIFSPLVGGVILSYITTDTPGGFWVEYRNFSALSVI
jgi:hypothetical protein